MPTMLIFIISTALATPPTWTPAAPPAGFDFAKSTRASMPGPTEYRDAPALPRIEQVQSDSPWSDAGGLSLTIAPDGIRAAACLASDSTEAEHRCVWTLWNIEEPQDAIELAAVPWKVRPQLVFVGDDIAIAVEGGVQIGERFVAVPQGVRTLAEWSGRVAVGTATGQLLAIDDEGIASKRAVIAGPIHSMAVDGDRVVIGGGQLVRVVDGDSIESYVAPSLVWGVAIDAQQVAAVHSDGIIVWAGEHEEPKKIAGRYGGLVSMADGVIHTRTSAGDRLAISVADGEPQSEPTQERMLPAGLPERYVSDWAWSPDKQRLAMVMRDGRLIVLKGDLVEHAFVGDFRDLESNYQAVTRWVGDAVWVLTEKGAFRAWGPDGEVVATGDTLLEDYVMPDSTWHLDGNKFIAQVGPWVREVDVVDGSVSDRGVSCTFGGLKIVPLEPGVRHPGVERCMWRAYLNRNGAILDADRGHLILPDGRKLGKRWWWGRFSSDGDVLLARSGTAMVSVDAQTGEQRASWSREGSEIRWDPYGKLAVARVGNDSTYIDVHTGENTMVVGPLDRRPVLAVEPAGTWFVTGHDDSSVRRWSARGDLLEVWRAGGVPTSMAVTEDGRVIIGTRDGAVVARRAGGGHDDLQLPRVNPVHDIDHTTAVVAVLPVGGRFGVQTADDYVLTFERGSVRPEGRWKVPPGTTGQDIFEALGAPNAEIDALVVDDTVVRLAGGGAAHLGQSGAHALPTVEGGALVAMADGSVRRFSNNGVLQSVTWMWEDGSWATWSDALVQGAGTGYELVHWPEAAGDSRRSPD